MKQGDHLEFYLLPISVLEVTRKRTPEKTCGAVQNVLIPIFKVSSKKLTGDRGIEFSEQVQTEDEGVPSERVFDRRGRLLRTVSEKAEKIGDNVTSNSTQKTMTSSLARSQFCLAIAR